MRKGQELPSLFVSFFHVQRASDHFPLLTMVRGSYNLSFCCIKTSDKNQCPDNECFFSRVSLNIFFPLALK